MYRLLLAGKVSLDNDDPKIISAIKDAIEKATDHSCDSLEVKIVEYVKPYNEEITVNIDDDSAFSVRCGNEDCVLDDVISKLLFDKAVATQCFVQMPRIDRYGVVFEATGLGAAIFAGTFFKLAQNFDVFMRDTGDDSGLELSFKLSVDSETKKAVEDFLAR
jgi:hypothetical protein